jgi:ankyrin repeat protein
MSSYFQPYSTRKGVWNVKEKLEETDLNEPCRTGKLEIVKDKVGKGLCKNTMNTALAIASCHGHLQIVQFLVENGAEPHYQNNYAVRLAAVLGRTDVVKFLLEHGADKDQALQSIIIAEHIIGDNRYDYDETYYGNLFHHFETTDLLIEKGAHKNKALNFACEQGKLTFVKILVEKGAEVSFENHYPVRAASSNGYLQIVKFLKEKGADITALNNHAVRSACLFGHLETVKFLHENGADLTAKNNIALKNACDNGYLEVVKYLVENGVDVTVDDNYPLCGSVNFGQLKVVQYLLENGADITARDNFSVKNSAKLRNFEMFTFLVSKGADVTANNNEILKYCLTSGINNKVLKYLIIYCNIDAQSLDKFTQKLFLLEKQKFIDAANTIVNWWIPKCYDLKRESGQRMAERNFEKFRAL